MSLKRENRLFFNEQIAGMVNSYAFGAQVIVGVSTLMIKLDSKLKF